jgi:hypothetical protein
MKLYVKIVCVRHKSSRIFFWHIRNLLFQIYLTGTLMLFQSMNATTSLNHNDEVFGSETHTAVVKRRQIVLHSALVLGNADFLQHIISSVGCNQYRFVAAVSKDFRNAYLQLFPQNMSTYYNASTIEHADICIMECRNIRQSATLCHAAIRHGSLPTLIYLHSLKYRWDDNVCNVAAQCGQLRILRYLRLNRCDWGKTCEYAAQYGHLSVLQWAQAQGCPWDELTCAKASEHGHLGILQWVRTNGCPWDEQTCSGAAGCGHLQILQWAHVNGCPWNEETCRCAARQGRLDILQWARQNGCPWNERTCTSAAANGHLEVVQWGIENGCQWSDRICLYAASRGHIEILKWAREMGYFDIFQFYNSNNHPELAELFETK